MTINLSGSLAQSLQRLAADSGRDMDSMVEDAVREYLEAAAITDVTPDDVARTQMTLAGELGELEAFPTGEIANGDETR